MEGNSIDEIFKSLDIPRSKIQSVIKKLVQFGSAETLPKRGRTLKLSAKTVRKLFCEVKIFLE